MYTIRRGICPWFVQVHVSTNYGIQSLGIIYVIIIWHRFETEYYRYLLYPVEIRRDYRRSYTNGNRCDTRHGAVFFFFFNST